MIKLTVLFENPFWIGIFEKIENGTIEVSRVVFGKEPKDYEVYEFVLKNYYNLKFSKPISTLKKPELKVNPKRMKREIKKTIQENGIGTKAQQALKQEYEKRKIESKHLKKEKREINQMIKFQQKQEKKKQKKRGH